MLPHQTENSRSAHAERLFCWATNERAPPRPHAERRQGPHGPRSEGAPPRESTGSPPQGHTYCHIEKLANLDQLPPTGFQVACFPFKIQGASAGFTRAVAIFED
jgi:hypothetical protein